MTNAPPMLPRIRVGFDGRWYNDSGVGAYVSGLLGAMAQLQGEIELLIYEDPANPLPLPNRANIQRVSVRAKKYSASGQIELAWRCHQDKLDVLHAPFYVVPLFAGCPVVVTVHDLIPFLFPVYRRLKSAVVRSGYRLAVRKAEHIIADSQNTANDIQRVLGVERDRISVVHLAAQEQYKAAASEGELQLIREKYGVRPPYAIVNSARNWRTKNLETALQALQAARQQSGAEFQTVLYGSPEGLTAAGGRERWSTLNLACTGFLPPHELAVLFRQATVFVTTSLYEGFGLPLLEAMSCGCAVVCSNGGALSEVAGSGAQLFDPFDVQGMAAAICALLLDDANLRCWRNAALQRSREFSWRKAAWETISVYHRARRIAMPGGEIRERGQKRGYSDGV